MGSPRLEVTEGSSLNLQQEQEEIWGLGARAPYIHVGRECRLVGGEGQLMVGCQAARKGVPQTCALSHYIGD